MNDDEIRDTEAREDEVYATYAARIEVPEMWSAVEARIRRASVRRERVRRFSLAAAAAIVLAVLGVLATREPSKPAVRPVAVRDVSSPAAEVSMHYQVAIARLEGGVQQSARNDPRAAAAAAALPELTRAIATAERAAASKPADPVAVTRLVAAYDAKLEVLRGATYVQ